MIERLRRWARTLKREIVVLWLAARDPRTPLLAKLLAGAVAAYALSPIDLIPDLVPVLGLLDDLILVPVGIWLALRLIPQALIAELRDTAAATAWPGAARAGAMGIVVVWVLAVVGAIVWWVV
jgi:uncharacterized membrane protein YkvA (DUF1232 family)